MQKHRLLEQALPSLALVVKPSGCLQLEIKPKSNEDPMQNCKVFFLVRNGLSQEPSNPFWPCNGVFTDQFIFRSFFRRILSIRKSYKSLSQQKPRKRSFTRRRCWRPWWSLGNRAVSRRGTTVHFPSLFYVLWAQSTRVAQLCAAIFTRDSNSSISKSGWVVVHHTIVIISYASRVDSALRHLSKLRAKSCREKGNAHSLKWHKCLHDNYYSLSRPAGDKRKHRFCP